MISVSEYLYLLGMVVFENYNFLQGNLNSNVPILKYRYELIFLKTFPGTSVYYKGRKKCHMSLWLMLIIYICRCVVMDSNT